MTTQESPETSSGRQPRGKKTPQLWEKETVKYRTQTRKPESRGQLIMHLGFGVCCLEGTESLTKDSPPHPAGGSHAAKSDFDALILGRTELDIHQHQGCLFFPHQDSGSFLEVPAKACLACTIFQALPLLGAVDFSLDAGPILFYLCGFPHLVLLSQL